jgi:hypothetical protein
MPWRVTKSSDGYSYEWFQEDTTTGGSSASLLTLVFLLLGKKLDEATVRQWVSEAERASTQGGVDRTTGVLTEKCKIMESTISGPADVRAVVTKATPKTPLLARVLRNDGATRTVVVVNQNLGNTICLDPNHGLVPISECSLMRYSVPEDGAGSGTIDQLSQFYPAYANHRDGSCYGSDVDQPHPLSWMREPTRRAAKRGS